MVKDQNNAQEAVNKTEFEELLQKKESMQQQVDEVSQLQQKVVDCEDKYRRALADYQNLQRRTQEQKAEWIKSANKDLLLKIFPLLDTLMLAEKHLNDKGIKIGIEQFLKVLEQEGIMKIKTIGEQFDPHRMEAITTQKGKNGIVLEEVRAGYLLYDSVLRSAQVIVGKEGE